MEGRVPFLWLLSHMALFYAFDYQPHGPWPFLSAASNLLELNRKILFGVDFPFSNADLVSRTAVAACKRCHCLAGWTAATAPVALGGNGPTP
ncbi:hypothetical protein LR48_Vigan215s000500 [Vigna angularis]|uniref:Amidohydrolase-related domain-containing protein n=1 Tax=Phaseolus angularis TaxID=3914 RepID=A0A0L9T608_PHAAN|nr:hypothetical protein LR48_Vigan215s000500 [Vigna angularis]